MGDFVINEGITRVIDDNGDIIESTNIRDKQSLDVYPRNSDEQPLYIEYKHTANLDAAARLRTSETTTLFDSKQLFDSQLMYWDEKTFNNGSTSYIANESSTRLQVTTTDTDRVIRQTREYLNYQPGRSFLIQITGTMGALKSNVTQRIGYFDDDNGLFFEQDGSDLKVVIRSKTSGSVVDTAITQSNWNLDTFDGNGNSGITIDTSKIQLYVIDFLWLGAGTVRFGFIVDGTIVYAHKINHANNISKVYISTPNLPIRFELKNTAATASNTTLDAICAVVSVEGGYRPKGVTRSYGTELTSKDVTTAGQPVISIRLKSSYIRAQIIPKGFITLVLSNDTILAQLYWGGTLTGANWSSVGYDSIAEYDTSATSFSGGVKLIEAYSASAGNSVTITEPDLDYNELFKILADIDGNSDTLTLVCKSIAGTSEVVGSLSWRELF